jgi:hypothetical protein
VGTKHQTMTTKTTTQQLHMFAIHVRQLFTNN